MLARAAGWPVVDYGESHFSLTKARIQELRELDYLSQWRMSNAKKWYHIKLADHSLMVFHETGDAASYSFLHSPIDAPSLREFLIASELDVNQRNEREQIDNFQMVLDTASLKTHITPVRFDYHEEGYKTGVHPVSHVHIGLNNNIRIACKKRMSAVSFSLFIMRQFYPENWERLLQHREAIGLPKAIRSDCKDLEERFWLALDQTELNLG
ncbi:DUF2290 domain-containing protein [Alcaligenaceae bacterium B3P038]|nr:DUF2290 domain-containing protein [Alcaligenaceae bacterium B3P038]